MVSMKYVLRTPKQIIYPDVRPKVTDPAMNYGAWWLIRRQRGGAYEVKDYEVPKNRHTMETR